MVTATINDSTWASTTSLSDTHRPMLHTATDYISRVTINKRITIQNQTMLRQRLKGQRHAKWKLHKDRILKRSDFILFDLRTEVFVAGALMTIGNSIVLVWLGDVMTAGGDMGPSSPSSSQNVHHRTHQRILSHLLLLCYYNTFHSHAKSVIGNSFGAFVHYRRWVHFHFVAYTL